jgi:hypothetical protein
LVDEWVSTEQGAQRFTTPYFRACPAVIAGAGGRLSGPFERLDRERRVTALDRMLALPYDIGLPDAKRIVPMMVEVNAVIPADHRSQPLCVI